MAIRVVRTMSALRRAVMRWRAAGERIALVPTMGALHGGHLALVRAARRRAVRTSARWPAWSAPMVGTSAMRSPLLRHGMTARRSVATVRMTRNRWAMRGASSVSEYGNYQSKCTEAMCLING